MPLDPEFVRDCPYDPDGLLLDAVLEIDREASSIVVSMPTHAELPITRTQRAHPVRHPRHVSGGLMVHMTGMAGFAHAYHLLGLRHRDGWIGYGGRIYRANFRALAPTGVPLHITCTQTSVRRGATRIFSRYSFRFHQEGEIVYLGDQSAMFVKDRALD